MKGKKQFVFFASGRKEGISNQWIPPLWHLPPADLHSSSLLEQFKISVVHDETGIYEIFHCSVNFGSVTYHTWKNKLDPGRAKEKLTENIF